MVSGMVAGTTVMPGSHVTMEGPGKFMGNQALVIHGAYARTARARAAKNRETRK